MVPTAAKAAAVSTAAHGGRDHRDGRGDQRAEDEEELLQPGLERVCGVPQALTLRAGSAQSPHAGAERRQRRARQRRAGREGDDRGAVGGEQGQRRERRRIHDAERQQHPRLPDAVDEPPPERPADRARERRRGDDDAGDGVRAALAAQQQHRRERRHPARQPTEQRGADDARPTPGAPSTSA